VGIAGSECFLPPVLANATTRMTTKAMIVAALASAGTRQR
jgi:hypothetical protein